jgi:hypothetical protein
MPWKKDDNGEWEYKFTVSKMQSAGDGIQGMWYSETKDFQQLVLDILASLPGGDMAEDMGGKESGLGWFELNMLGELINAIENESDVEEMCEALMGPPEEEEENPEEEE